MKEGPILKGPEKLTHTREMQTVSARLGNNPPAKYKPTSQDTSSSQILREIPSNQTGHFQSIAFVFALK